MLITKAHAATTTSTTSEPGQVLVKSEGDVLYLDTQVNPGGPTANSTNNQTFQLQPIFSKLQLPYTSQIIKPAGFVSDLGVYLSSILSLVMVVCVLLVFFNFIQAGFQWITSGGDKSKIDEARNRITHAFIGIIIVSSSFAMMAFIAYLLGVSSVEELLSSIPTLQTI